jgi:hypothetical protein
LIENDQIERDPTNSDEVGLIEEYVFAMNEAE